jgi:hypothetical protein
VLLLQDYDKLRSDGAIEGDVITGQAGIVWHDGGARMYTARQNVSLFFKNPCGYTLVRSRAKLNGSDCLSRVFFAQENFFEKVARPLQLCESSQWRKGWDVTTAPLELPQDLLDDYPCPSLRNRLRANISLLSLRRKRNTNLGRTSTDLREMMFENAPADFKFEEGQRIGIIVSSVGLEKAATPRNTELDNFNFNQDQVDAIYGTSNSVKLYTGKIKHVGPNYIGHDINGHGGVSGSIIFLLKCSDQLVSVPQEHYGKGIAVHVGNNNLRGGIGLLITMRASAPWRYRLRLPQAVSV